MGVALALAALQLGCDKEDDERGGPVVTVQPSNPDSVIAIGRGLTYDANPGASARSIVDGVDVTVEPTDDAWAVDEASLAQGVIVARLTNNTDLPLPRFALAPHGTAYWVVFQAGTAWQSAMIADGTDRALDVSDVPTLKHRPTRPWRQSVAQWQLRGILEGEAADGIDPKAGLGALGVAKEVQPWVSCTPWGCCKFLR